MYIQKNMKNLEKSEKNWYKFYNNIWTYKKHEKS